MFDNLYLYLPPHSAHPPGVIKSLIFGLTRKYKLQNSDPRDYKSMLVKLYQRLLARGHSDLSLFHLFEEAIQTANTVTLTSSNDKTDLEHANTTEKSKSNLDENRIFFKIK